jgi:tripartite ATP-independent transporter DctM subunit
MTEFQITLIGLLFLFVLLLMGVPVAFSMFLVGFFGLISLQGFDRAIVLVGSTSYHAIANWLFVVIPMFILMGEFAGESGIVADIFAFFRAWVGRTSGSLGIVTILTSTLFSFATGSSLAATAVIGKLALPEMKKSNYEEKLSLGCVAAGGTLGNLIPPSISLIIFGIITDVAIRDLLIGGIIPGLLAALMFIFWITITVILKPKSAPRMPPSTWKEKLLTLRKTWGMTLLFFAILGSIYTGIATVSEAATVGCFVTFLIALLMRKLTLVKLRQSLLNTGSVTSMVFLLLVGVTVFSRFLVFSGFTNELVRFATEGAISPFLIICAILFTFLLLGCIIDPASLILLTVPIFFPIVVNLGFHPVWFGIMAVVMTQIGFLTPPVGMCVYVLHGVSGVPLEKCFASAIYPLIMWSIVVVLLVVFPSIVTWLPNMM